MIFECYRRNIEGEKRGVDGHWQWSQPRRINLLRFAGQHSMYVAEMPHFPDSLIFTEVAASYAFLVPSYWKRVDWPCCMEDDSGLRSLWSVRSGSNTSIQAIQMPPKSNIIHLEALSRIMLGYRPHLLWGSPCKVGGSMSPIWLCTQSDEVARR